MASHTDVAAITFHTNYPAGNDPFYVHNTTDNLGRLNFYTEIWGVPWLWMDGILEPNYPYTTTSVTNAYNTRKAVPTSVNLTIEGSYDDATRAVEVTVTASTDAALPAGTWRLHIGLTESGIYFNAPNGTQIHDHVMRDMFPSYNGTSVTFSGGFPQTASASANFTLMGLYVAEECRIVAWLQNHSTKEVYQSGMVLVTELTGGLSGVADLVSLTGLVGAYPNPFNPNTTVAFRLENEGPVRLGVFDLQGREVAVLANDVFPQGEHRVSWRGVDARGRAVGSGVYFLQFVADGRSESTKLVLLR